MQISNFSSVEELNIAGADFIISRLKGQKSNLLCAATGDSATGIYKTLISRKNEIDLATLKLIKLDEWAGLPMDHPGSCDNYLNRYLLQPLDIPANNYISFNSNAGNASLECVRIKAELETSGPIDVCVLGLGLNGHIAFNDPANELQPNVHLAKLSETSIAHPMIKDVNDKPQYGYTLGIGDILQSKSILLVVQGSHKREIFNRFLKAQVTTQLPASLLWLHGNAYCYYCEN